MKIFKVTKDVVLNPEREFFTLKNGIEIPALLLGEQGRGRQLEVIPLRGIKVINDKDKDIYLTKVDLAQTRSGGLALKVRRFTDKSEVKRKIEKDEEFLMLVKAPYSFRGVGKLEIDDSKVLARGNYAQGLAGRMGWTFEYLVKVTPKDLPLRMETSGRTYGDPDSFIIFLQDGILQVLPEEEYELLQ